MCTRAVGICIPPYVCKLLGLLYTILYTSDADADALTHITVTVLTPYAYNTDSNSNYTSTTSRLLLASLSLLYLTHSTHTDHRPRHDTTHHDRLSCDCSIDPVPFACLPTHYSVIQYVPVLKLKSQSQSRYLDKQITAHTTPTNWPSSHHSST